MEIKVIKGLETHVYRSDIIPRIGERVRDQGGYSFIIEDVVYIYDSKNLQLLHVELWLGAGV